MSCPGRPRRSRGGARPLMVLAALAVASSWSSRAARAEPLPDSDYAIDESTGHSFRVRYNPAGRVWVGVAGAVAPTGEDVMKPTPEVSLGISYRAIYTFGEGEGRVVWQLDHRIIPGWIWPLRRLEGGVPAMDAVLYSVSLHRHDEAPSVALPSSPPVSVPFPFDIGFEAEMGRVFVPAVLPFELSTGAAIPMLRVGVLRATAFLDPLRAGTPGRSIEIGVGGRYDIDAMGRFSLGEPRLVHRIAPMTATSLRLRFQSSDGLTVLEGRGDVIPHWTSEQAWKLMGIANARVERTLMAINDQPIAAVIEGGYRRTPETSRTQRVDDVRVSLGLTFNLQIQ